MRNLKATKRLVQISREKKETLEETISKIDRFLEKAFEILSKLQRMKK